MRRRYVMRRARASSDHRVHFDFDAAANYPAAASPVSHVTSEILGEGIGVGEYAILWMITVGSILC